MNCQKAKKIDMLLYFKKLGFEPQKKRGSDTWFLSPFRGEKTASFKINTNKNCWYDYGEGCGGTIIDFLQKFHRCTISEALEKLASNTFSFHQQSKIISATKQMPIHKTKKIENRYLIAYLAERKINFEYANQFCLEVHYVFKNNKTHYAIGFKNDLSGFELRNRFFKGCIGKKHLTTFKRAYSVVSIFEGWTDLLSYFTLKKHIPQEDFIILNSTSLVKKSIDLLGDYTAIKLFFNNDAAGNIATNILIKIYKNKVTDNRIHYKNYNDLNEYLIKTK